jgi:hypothetical protein
MTLGELKKDLRKHGKRVVASGAFRFSDDYSAESDPERVTIYFAGDEKIVFPNPPQSGIYPLVTKTGLDSEEIHPEKVKALKRALLPDWDENEDEE